MYAIFAVISAGALVRASTFAETPQTTPAASAASDLQAHLAGLHSIRTLEVQFTCEKDLAMVDSPLISTGRLWIRQADKSAPSAVRFSTEKPYVSELILTDGKVFGRSQHEEEWTVNAQSNRPGLSAVMGQLGGWSTGDAGKLRDLYAVDRSTVEVPVIPDASADEKLPPHIDRFRLTPVQADLAKAVKHIDIAVDHDSPRLVFLEIVTNQDDQTRYWFYAPRVNAALAPDLFKPKGDLKPADDVPHGSGSP
jgi:outer membrane lipoprotein-sorting protein